MSHRKFEHPRHRSFGFLTSKIANKQRDKVKAFPKEDPTKPCRFTSFLGYKAGMTHIERDLPNLRKQTSEAVTVFETPTMVVVGMVGYVKTPRGLRTLSIVWAQHLSEEVRRRFYKNWAKSKKKDFTKYIKKHVTDEGKKDIQSQLEELKKYCDVIRVLAQTQIGKMKGLKKKKAHMDEIQINGGDIAKKVDYAYSFFEKKVHVDEAFSKDEIIDITRVTKGNDYEGAVTRWGVIRVPRKTHCGIRKVACIGAWHPPPIGPMYKKVCRIGKPGQENHSARTEFDRTEKEITPVGGFPNFGVVKEDYLLIKGCCAGPKNMVVTLRQTLGKQTSRVAMEEIKLKFIDTGSYCICKCFQRSSQEKVKFYPRV